MRFFTLFAFFGSFLLETYGSGFKENEVEISTGDETRKWIESKIEENTYMVFGKSRCPFTVKAVELLKSKGLEYDFVALDNHPDGVLIRDELREITGGYRKVPQIFVNGNFIKGFVDLEAHLKDTLIRRRLGEARFGAAELVEDLINSHEVVVFGKAHCGYTRRVKVALENNNIHFFFMDLSQMDKGPEIQDELLSRTGIRTVPQVFVRGKFFGDSTQTIEKLSDGLLDFQKQDL
eukprot:GHVP01069835.1.p1 GENE.GHVP01069835.1~~GHVP01069835.1.p1  ORF type:complete len:235 (+),score=41.60 GHVP01069835.1:3-707(+)